MQTCRGRCRNPDAKMLKKAHRWKYRGASIYMQIRTRKRRDAYSDAKMQKQTHRGRHTGADAKTNTQRCGHIARDAGANMQKQRIHRNISSCETGQPTNSSSRYWKKMYFYIQISHISRQIFNIWAPVPLPLMKCVYYFSIYYVEKIFAVVWYKVN